MQTILEFKLSHVIILCVLAVSVTTGCRGCRQEDPQAQAQREAEEKAEEEEELEEKRKKAEFEIGEPILQPGREENPLQLVKPGHWVMALQPMKANYFNFVGQSTASVVDAKGQPIPIDRTPFLLNTTRPVALTKARGKNINTLIFVPQVKRPMRLRSVLRERRSGQIQHEATRGLTPMHPYQYFFVVLAKEPTRYTFLKSSDAVLVPYDGTTDYDDTEDTLHYHVLQPDTSRNVPLSDNPLTWSSIAYILWDEIDPEQLSPTQSAALIDWLHWGGQLIINGPDSFDLLDGSFLEPYLPATSRGACVLDVSDLEELNSGWVVESPIRRGRKPVAREPLVPSAPWSGVDLEIHPAARPLRSTGELLVEREVGRGRIVASAMQLSERDLINWSSGFGNLLNNAILRRSPRRYQAGVFGDATLLWSPKELADHRLDARLTTRLRYFARDLGVDTNYREIESDSVAVSDTLGVPQPVATQVAPRYFGGIGAWNDFSDVAVAARASLREAAGVEVPGAGFVMGWLAAYLVVLVPFNWLFFRALGRVEWAWVAAPVIAVAGALAVVHQAQLDIGFVRAQTEIGVMELQVEHPRAHLTRFTALYTSLSTTYDIEFDNLTTLATPFPVDEKYTMLRGQSRSLVGFQRHDKVQLTGMRVSSSSTDMLHSEQMFTLDGPVRLGTSSRGHRQIENQSQLDMKSAALVRRPAPDETIPAGAPLEGIWIGDLDAGTSKVVSFLPLQLAESQTPFRTERDAAARAARQERLKLDELLKLAYDPAGMEAGETRLVARIDQVLPGETVQPAASQVRGATLVVAHLNYAPPQPARADVNLRVDVIDTP